MTQSHLKTNHPRHSYPLRIHISQPARDDHTFSILVFNAQLNATFLLGNPYIYVTHSSPSPVSNAPKLTIPTPPGREPSSVPITHLNIIHLPYPSTHHIQSSYNRCLHGRHSVYQNPPHKSPNQESSTTHIKNITNTHKSSPIQIYRLGSINAPYYNRPNQ